MAIHFTKEEFLIRKSKVVKELKKQKSKIISIVNAFGSSLVRESDYNLYLNCGPEIGVAATKSFTSQLVVI